MTTSTADLRAQRAAMLNEVSNQASIVDRDDHMAVPHMPSDPSQLEGWFIEHVKILFERDVNQVRQQQIASGAGLAPLTADDASQIRKLHEGVLEDNIRRIKEVADRAKSKGRTASPVEYCKALMEGVKQHNQATINGEEYPCANPGCGNVTSLQLRCEKCKSVIYCRQACKNADRLAHERVCQIKSEPQDKKAKQQEKAPSSPTASGQLKAVHVISTEEHTCANTACGKTSNKITHFCSRCRDKFYCNKDCQLADWRAGHKTICIVKKKPKSAGS